MVWVFAIVLLLLIAFVPAVRKAALVLLAISVVTIAYCSYQSKQAREAARNRVSPAELQFDDLRFGGSSYAHQLTGRVRNRSPRYSVNIVAMRIQPIFVSMWNSQAPCRSVDVCNGHIRFHTSKPTKYIHEKALTRYKRLSQ
jgi:hypothetical protein